MRALVRLVRPFVGAYDGTIGRYDMAVNGEHELLDRLGSDARVAFDVGANVGEWTVAARRSGVGEVHAFEAVPATASLLSAATGQDARVHVNGVGLGAVEGVMTMRVYPDNLKLSTTATAFLHDLPHRDAEVAVTTGDRYVADHAIDRIDVLKLDVEGEEPNVLEGFRSTFEAGRIDVVQFEYGLVNLLSRFFVADFYELLNSWDFDLGPLVAGGVRFQEYTIELETFRFVNYVAVHRSRGDLRDRLAFRG